MSGITLNKNSYFFIALGLCILIILYNSPSSVPKPKPIAEGETFGFPAPAEGDQKGQLPPASPFGDLPVANPATGGFPPGDAPLPPPPNDLVDPLQEAAKPPVPPVPPQPPLTPDAPSLPNQPAPPSLPNPPAAPKPNAPPAPPTPPASTTGSEKQFFQHDLLDLANPKFDIHKLKQYKQHNYQGPGHETFATYLSSRNGSMQEPYFLAAQQLVYRLLWNQKTRSLKHPVTVFVAPHIPDPQRDLLSAAGALVRELDLVEGHADTSSNSIWRDLFSKLNMWAQTDYTRITFLDLDAFPLQNIDGIFDATKKQLCEKALLPADDLTHEKEICEYIFAGAQLPGGKEINAGVMVFEPNKALHQHLMRESTHVENFNNSMAEQPFLNWAFRHNGPFPPAFIDRTWNGFFPNKAEAEKLKVMHVRLWAIGPDPNDPLAFAGTYFRDTWKDMLALYESKEFESMRAADGTRAYR